MLKSCLRLTENPYFFKVFKAQRAVSRLLGEGNTKIPDATRGLVWTQQCCSRCVTCCLPTGMPQLVQIPSPRRIKMTCGWTRPCPDSLEASQPLRLPAFCRGAFQLTCHRPPLPSPPSLQHQRLISSAHVLLPAQSAVLRFHLLPLAPAARRRACLDNRTLRWTCKEPEPRSLLIPPRTTVQKHLLWGIKNMQFHKSSSSRVYWDLLSYMKKIKKWGWFK